MADSRDLVALPMHGEVKLRNEGYRTRDGHILEWIERLRPELDVTVRSRPEPFPRLSLARRHGRANPAWQWQSPQPLTVPSPGARRKWWVRSLKFEPKKPIRTRAALVWNPIAGAHLLGSVIEADRVGVDLLDDWSVHIAFQPIRQEVERAYERIFELADTITANSEGTVALAARFGREAELITNGCDPERFEQAGDRRAADGPPVIGYVGKLSERLDVELIERTAAALPQVRFEVSGPFAAASRKTVTAIKALDRLPNVKVSGNVPYDQLPLRIATWDIGWVPHRLGEGEVGGDVMKIYEYRAAGLPTVITPIIGAHRRLAGVSLAADAEETVAAFDSILGSTDPPRPPRLPVSLDSEMTWKTKSARILQLLGL